MYLIAIILLMLVLPAISVAAEAFLHPGAAPLMDLIGKWFVFWAVGVRLFAAGISQNLRPQFTAEGILGVKEPGAQAIVRELGFANLSLGTIGLLSLPYPGFLLPAAGGGGLFYGLAGLGHIVRQNRNLKEQTALISDLAIFLLLAAFVLSRAF
jgi:hypothetical protein